MFRAAIIIAANFVLVIPCSGASQESRWSTHAIAAAAFDDTQVKLALVEVSTRVSANLTAGGAVALVDVDDVFRESQLRLHVAGALSRKNWTLENRHLVSIGSETDARYRLRLRAIRHELFGSPHWSLRVFDELHVDIRRSRGIRNNFAAGVGLKIGQRGTLELYQVWSDERISSDSSYLLLVFTLRASN